jgi:hypothetical protein
MRAMIRGVLVLVGLGLGAAVVLSGSSPERNYVPPNADDADDYAVMLAWFYDYHGLEQGVNKGLPYYAAKDTEYFAKVINLYEHVPTMLAMWHRESGYKSITGDDGKSFGITQTMRHK